MKDRQSMGDGATMVSPGGAAKRAELSPGDRLGRYEILRLLGKGGMGQVYLARHELQKSQHALKILPLAYSDRPGFVDRFHTELQTMANMQHPNIVHVQYSDEENGRHYLVMDFVAADGGNEPYDLEEALAVEGRFSAETVRRLAIQLCSGLAYAHGRGVVHRDLKPANVLLTSKNLSVAEVRICDFGLAKVVGEDEVRSQMAVSLQRSMGDQKTFVEKRREERSSDGVVLGTYGYMSPEQEEGKPADERSDIYALGVMFYRMLTGQRLRGMAKPASQIVKGLNPVWDGIINGCLETDPAARWQTASELMQAIGRLSGMRASGSRGPICPEGANPALRVVLTVAYYSRATLEWVIPVFGAVLRKLSPALQSGSGKVLREVKSVNRTRVAWIVGVAVAAGVLVWSYRSYKTYTVRRDQIRVAAEYKKYRDKVDEQSLVSTYPSATQVWEEVKAVLKTQENATEGENLKEMWVQAEWNREKGNWTQALNEFEEFIKECNRVKQLYVVKKAPEALRRPAGRGDHIVPPGFSAPGAAAAPQAFAGAQQAYQDTLKRQQSEQSYAKMKDDFENALAADVELLEQHGGVKWGEVRKQWKIGMDSADKPSVGMSAYAAALVALPAAVAEAKEAEKAAEKAQADKARREAEAQQAAMARADEEQRAKLDQERAEAAATALAAARAAKAAGQWTAVTDQVKVIVRLEEERKAAAAQGGVGRQGGVELAEAAEARALQTEAEQKLAEQRERVHGEQVAAALTAARAAKAKPDWQEVLSQAAQVLQLEAEWVNNAAARGGAGQKGAGAETAEMSEARALQAEAAQAMAPKLTLIVESDGKALSADISDGKTIYKAPYTFMLAEGAAYELGVSCGEAADGSRYKNAVVRVRADWQGSRTNRVVLEKVSMPATGKPWVSPSTGMAFVWVPALKMWVGKYEVTNDEYGKKEFHSSGDYKGLDLNGARQPVVGVDFDAAVSYAWWMTKHDVEKLGGLRYRVPSEDEWLAFTQCGDNRIFPWGNAMPPKYGNYSDNSSAWTYKISGYADGFSVTCPVEKSGVNEWGIVGAGGNVGECCAVDQAGATFASWRGSAWNSHMPDYMRCAYRITTVVPPRQEAFGFRLVLSR